MGASRKRCVHGEEVTARGRTAHKDSKDCCSSSIDTSSPCISLISSNIPDSSIISWKNSSSTPDDMNASMSESASSASPVASYTRLFSTSDSTAYACQAQPPPQKPATAMAPFGQKPGLKPVARTSP